MSIEKRYTPGPWRLHTRALAHVTSEEHAIANCSCWDISYEDTNDEKIANAYLIASAPDLLDALECMLPLMKWKFGDRENCPEVARAEDAIAKACGESSEETTNE